MACLVALEARRAGRGTAATATAAAATATAAAFRAIAAPMSVLTALVACARLRAAAAARLVPPPSGSPSCVAVEPASRRCAVRGAGVRAVRAAVAEARAPWRRPRFVHRLANRELFDLRQHPLTLRGVRHRVYFRDAHLHPRFVVVRVLCDFELHHEAREVGVEKGLFVRLVIRVPQFLQPVSGHAHQHVPGVPERADPVLAGVVRNRGVDDVPPLAVRNDLPFVPRARPRTSRVVVPELLLTHALAVFKRARGVKRALLVDFQVRHVTPALHPERGRGAVRCDFILQVRERDAPVAAAAAAAGKALHLRRGAAFVVVPHPQLRAFRKVGVDVHVRRVHGAEVLALELADSAVFKRKHRVLAVRHERLELATDIHARRCPHGELD